MAPATSLVAWTLFSAVVGAGYASGRELVVFFLPCRGWALPAALGAGLLIALAAHGPSGAGAGRRGLPPWVDRAVIGGISWVSLAAMMAGTAHLVDPARARPFSGVVVAGALIWAGASLPPARGLARISRWLGPPIAVGMMGLAAAWAVAGRIPGEAGPQPWREGWLPRCLTNTATYAASNAVFARGALDALAGSLAASPGAAPRGATAGGLLVGVVATAGLSAMLAAGTSDLPMPLVEAASRLHPVSGWLYRVVLLAAIYTTGVAAATSLASLAAPHGVSPGHAGHARWALLWVASAVPAAAPGFAETVGQLYPAAGIVALAYLLVEAALASLAGPRLY